MICAVVDQVVESSETNTLLSADFASADLHRRLDQAVSVAYGWPPAIAQDRDDTNRRLLELNQQIAAGEVEYKPFAD